MAELVEEKAPWTKNNKSLYIYNINSKPDYCIETIWNSNLIKKLIWKSWFNIQSELEFVSSLQCLRDEPGPPPPDVPAAAASTAPDDLAARQPPFRFTMGWLGFEWLFCLGKRLNGWELLVSIGKEALEASFELRLNQGWQCLLNQGLKFEGPVRALRAPGEVVQTASFEPSSIGFAPQDIWRVECDPAGHWQDFGGSTCRGSCPICLQEWCLHGNPGLHNLFTRASWLQGVGEPGGD